MGYTINILTFYNLYTHSLLGISVALIVLLLISEEFLMGSPKLNTTAADCVILWFFYVITHFVGLCIGTPVATSICSGLFLTALFCRNVVNGRSIGQRIPDNMQVVDSVTGKAVSPFRSIIRNVFVLFWFVDYIPWIFTGRRIADYLLRTKVVKIEDVGCSCRSYYIFTWDMIFWIVMCFAVSSVTFYAITTHLELFPTVTMHLPW